jgi:hypothetical protein
VAFVSSGSEAYSRSQELPHYLSRIVPPVLACFTDQDARVRYYACEAMYNIAKVAKGEILIYFNDIFDALCKVSLVVLAEAGSDEAHQHPQSSSAPTRSFPSRTVQSS